MRLFTRSKVWVAICLGFALGHPLRAGEDLPLPEFRFAAPFPQVVETARVLGISMAGFDAPTARTTLELGDTFTALVTHTDGDETRQWLVQFTVTALQGKEKDRRPEITMTMTNEGANGEKEKETFRFKGTSTALETRTIGPFAAENEAKGKAPRLAPEKRARAVVSSEFLGLGLDRAAVVLLPKPTAPVANHAGVGEKNAASVKWSPEDKRAFVGTLPALMEFFKVARSTAGLEDLLKTVVDVSWWSIVRNLSFNIDFDFRDTRIIDATPWLLPERAPMYALPFVLHINKKPALVCQLAVVDPAPPLRTSAGIVGIAAQRPDGKGPHLMIRLLAARVGPASEPGGLPPLPANP